MVAQKTLGAFGVARLQRLDDPHVIADRAIGAILLADGLAADHPHMREQVLRQREQHAVAAHAHDGLVELDVHLGVFVEPRVQLAVLEPREHRAQRGNLVIARVLRDQPRSHALERRPGGDHLDHLALGLAHDVNAAARNGADEPLALKLRHGFAHRGAAYTEIGREAPLVEADIRAVAIDIHCHDRVFERGVGAALETFRSCDRLDARRHDRPARVRARLGARPHSPAQAFRRTCQFDFFDIPPDAGKTGGTTTATHLWYTIFQGRRQRNWLISFKIPEPYPTSIEAGAIPGGVARAAPPPPPLS